MLVSKNNKKYTPPNGQKIFKTKFELQNAVNDWCSNNNKEKLIESYGHITNWKLSKDIHSLESLFENQATFNEDLSGWNVSYVSNTNKMFCGCVSFLGLGLEKWKTHWFHGTFCMFYNCHSLICDLSAWNVMHVHNAKGMFYGCSNFNCNLSSWRFKHVKDIHTCHMFDGCSNFNSDLSNWDMSSVVDMNHMFYGCSNFNSDLSGWNVSRVKNMTNMFHGCSNFNSDLSGWNVKSVELFNNMFNKCTKQTLFSIISWIEINPNVLTQLLNNMKTTLPALYLLYAAHEKDNNLFLHLTLDMPDILNYV